MSYLVILRDGQLTWKRHVDHLRARSDSPFSREESFDLTVQSPAVENLPQQIVELPQRIERQPSVEKQHHSIEEIPPAPVIPAPTSLKKRLSCTPP